jgi:O-antigen/teichoic acid export membrane protein
LLGAVAGAVRPLLDAPGKVEARSRALYPACRAGAPPSGPDRSGNAVSIGRRFFGNTFFNWLGTAVATLASIVLTPYLIHHLEPERFGVYQISRQFVLYLALFDAGVLGALMRYTSQAVAARDPDRLNEIANSALILYGVIAMAGLLVSAGAAWLAPGFFRVDPVHAAETTALFLGLGGWWALTMLACPARCILIGHQRYGLLSLINSSSWILTVGLIIGLFSLGRISLTSVGLAFIGGAGLQTVGFNLIARQIQPTLRWTRRHVARAALRSLSGFGLWNMLFTIAGLFLWATDSIVIGRVLGPAYAALYAVPFMLIQYGRMVGSGFMGPLIPLAAGQSGDRAALQTTLIRATRLGLILSLATNGLLVILAEDLLRLWIGPDFAGGWIIYAYLMSSFWAVYAQRPIYAILLGAGDIRGPAAMTFAAGLGTVVLKIVALERFGLGIEAVALLNLVLVLPVMLVYMPLAGCRLAGFPLRRLYREAYLGPILAFLVVLGLGWLGRAQLPPPGPLAFALMFAGLASVYLGLALLTLAPDERGALRSLLVRPRRRLRPAGGS